MVARKAECNFSDSFMENLDGEFFISSGKSFHILAPPPPLIANGLQNIFENISMGQEYIPGLAIRLLTGEQKTSFPGELFVHK